MTSTDDLKPGSLFAGKYRIEKHVGKGGMSSVYEATNLMLQSPVALKVMSDDLAEVPEAVERFIREGIATSRVKHRAIVKVFDAGEHKGTPWIAMEYLDGESLNERFAREGPLPAGEVIRIAKEIAAGLGAAHEQGVIHRDLKPHNVFLDNSQDPPQPKILDFGIAKLSDSGMAKLTQTGLMMGTPHYMSPEQAQGAKDIGTQADFWALGVIMLEGISGHMPYEAESVAAYLGQLVTAKPRGANELAPQAHPGVRQVIERCLEVDPKDRPANAREIIQELEALASELLAGSKKQEQTFQPKINEPASIAESMVPVAAPPPPESSQREPGEQRMESRTGKETDGALTGKPGVIPAQPEISATMVAVPQNVKPRSLPLMRRPPVIVGLVVATLMGTLGIVAISYGITRSYCVDLGVQQPPTVADRTQTPETPPTSTPGATPMKLPAPPDETPTKLPLPPDITLDPESVAIDSDPRGAKVILNGFEIGKLTPTKIRLDSTAHIELRLDGYMSTSKIFQPGQPTLFFKLQKSAPPSPNKSPGTPNQGAKTPGKSFQEWAEHALKKQ